MAKGLRSKVKRRLRTARAAHYWELRGKAANERTNARLNDPTYTTAGEHAPPVNAFLEPNNPMAVFP